MPPPATWGAPCASFPQSHTLWQQILHQMPSCRRPQSRTADRYCARSPRILPVARWRRHSALETIVFRRLDSAEAIVRHRNNNFSSLAVHLRPRQLILISRHTSTSLASSSALSRTTSLTSVPDRPYSMSRLSTPASAPSGAATPASGAATPVATDLYRPLAAQIQVSPTSTDGSEVDISALSRPWPAPRRALPPPPLPLSSASTPPLTARG